MHSGDNSKNLTKESKGVPFYEAKTTRDQRIVYSIEIAPDEDKKEDRQIIKIWGIMTHTEVARRNWGLISRETLSRGPEYLRRCNARDKQIQRGHQKLNMPESWPWKTTRRDVEVTASKPTDIVDRSEAEFLELHAALSSVSHRPSRPGGLDLTPSPSLVCADSRSLCRAPKHCLRRSRRVRITK